VLLRSSHLQVIVDDLIASGKWKVSDNWADHDCSTNHTAIHDEWLKSGWLGSLLWASDFGLKRYTSFQLLAIRSRLQMFIPAAKFC
jgi:hypothetical protein